MTLEAYIRALIRQWEKGTRDPEDVVREIRTALAEEDEIRAAEAAADRDRGRP